MSVSLSRIAVLLALAVFVSVTGCARCHASGKLSELQQRLDGLAAKIEARQIRRVEILHIPLSVRSFMDVTPGALEDSYHYKLTIAHFRASPDLEKVAKLLRSLRVKAASGDPQGCVPGHSDVRWAVLFYAVDGSLVESIYLDGYGTRGVLGTTAVAIDGDLLSWVKSCLPERFH